MKTLLLLLLATLAACATARAQVGPTVLDWKANTTLTSYLTQQLHAQYAGRAAELGRAAQSAAGAAAYRDSVRARCRRVLGPLPARTPLHAQVVGQLVRPGLRIEKIIYESTPHHHVTANLYVPDGPGQWPAVLLPCGHEAEAKATISYQQTALLLATHGFAVLVPDPVSQGERLQLTDAAGKGLTRGGTTEHTLLNAQAALVGHNLPAAELWDNIRALDYLATRSDVDTARFGCLGNSGGATQTAYLLALEPRLKVAALCSYVAAGERNLELTGPADGCVMLPNAGRFGLDLADWPIAFAPKPLLLLAGRYDFVDYHSIETAHAEIGSIYQALGRPQQHELFTAEDGHGISKPKREVAVRFFLRWLAGEAAAAAVAECPLPVATARELQCTATGQVNTSFADEENLSTFYQAEARRLAARRPVLKSPNLGKQFLSWVGEPNMRALFAIGDEKELPDFEVEQRDTLRRGGLLFQQLIVRSGRFLPLPVLRLDAPAPRPGRRLLICFADAGKVTLADSTVWLRTQLQHYDTVLLADLRGQGETADPAAALDPKYYNREYRPALLSLHLGLSLLYQRLADAVQLARYGADLRPGGRLVDFYAVGPSSELVALHAGTCSGLVSRVRLRALPASWQERLAQPTAHDAYSDVVPGVLQRYDVPDLARALGRRLVVEAR
ncbi:MAG: acetylxylan esterase [Bacteroidota bacterium]|nr:acetylxylan esterase [Bacteroidota bacterium]